MLEESLVKVGLELAKTTSFRGIPLKELSYEETLACLALSIKTIKDFSQNARTKIPVRLSDSTISLDNLTDSLEELRHNGYLFMTLVSKSPDRIMVITNHRKEHTQILHSAIEDWSRNAY